MPEGFDPLKPLKKVEPPEEKRFTWATQREDRTQRRYEIPSWFPVQERWKPQYGAIPQFAPQYTPLTAPMTLASQEQARRMTAFSRPSLIENINWYYKALGYDPYTGIDKATGEPIPTGGLGAELEDIKSEWLREKGEPARIAGEKAWRAQRQYGQQLPPNVEHVIEQAESLGIDTTEFEEAYAKAPSEMARGFILTGFNQEVNQAFNAKQTRESRILAREFPEEFGAYAEQMRSQYEGVGRFAPPEETFYGQFTPELQREHEARQFQEYPQLYPWYQEAGGRETGKTFQEWIPSEPLATAYLSERQRQEAIPKETRKPRWQPARG